MCASMYGVGEFTPLLAEDGADAGAHSEMGGIAEWIADADADAVGEVAVVVGGGGAIPSSCAASCTCGELLSWPSALLPWLGCCCG